MATLRGRVDTLEARTAELEANQFSTTTKLTGQVLTYLGDAFGKNADRANNTAFGYRVRLKLNTSFTGKDNLLVGLEATNLRRLDAATEFPQSRLRGATDETLFSATNTSGDGSFKLNALQYSFPVGDKLQVFLNAFSSDRPQRSSGHNSRSLITVDRPQKLFFDVVIICGILASLLRSL